MITDLLPIQVSEVACATRNQTQLSKVLRCCRQSWPREVPEELKPYWGKKEELSTEKNCIMWGSRVVIPVQLRQVVLHELHRGHEGIVKIKQLAWSYVWWPKIDKEMDEVVKAFALCQSECSAPPRVILQPWPWPSTPWERVHVDFLGPFMGKMMFVAVDAHSKWPEAQIITSTTAAQTITTSREMFPRKRLPKQLVSDNGPQFRAQEFEEFLTKNGVKHVRTAPYHLATNGAAERFVRPSNTH